MKKNIRLGLWASAVIILAGAGYGVTKALEPGMTAESHVLYSYNLSAGGSYDVSLIENELYPEGVLGEDSLYARGLIDRLSINFTAEYSGNQAAQISGDYSVAVIVQGYQNIADIRRVVYQRRFPIIENQPIQGETAAKISDIVSLDLNTYKSFADKAEQILNSKPGRDAAVVFSGTFLALTEYGEVEEPFSYSVFVPLTNELFSITKEVPVSKTEVIDEIKEVPAQISYNSIIVPALSVMIGMLSVIILAFFVRQPTAEEMSVLKFKAIQRKHGTRMVRLNRIPLIPPEMQVEVTDLNSLVSISDERRQFVCYSLNEDGLPADGLLYVCDGERYYMLHLE